jgi:hypothetical protein
MVRKPVLLAMALSLAVPALADTTSKTPVQRAAITKPANLPVKGHNHPKNPANNGKPAPCITPGFNVATNSQPCK